MEKLIRMSLARNLFRHALVNTNLSRSFHSSMICNVTRGYGGDWRQSQGKPTNPMDSGPLTDLPDYTFLDGRPTPYRAGQLKRALKQKDYSERIVKLSKEIDDAIEYQKKADEKKEDERNEILKNKLKEKKDKVFE